MPSPALFFHHSTDSDHCFYLSSFHTVAYCPPSLQAGGPGQHIDASLLDCCVASLANVASATLLADWPARPWGTAHESIVPYQAFPTAGGGHVVVAAMNDRQFRALCVALARPDLGDPAGPYASNAQRVQRRVALIAELEVRGPPSPESLARRRPHALLPPLSPLRPPSCAAHGSTGCACWRTWA